MSLDPEGPGSADDLVAPPRPAADLVTFGEHRQPTALPRWMVLVIFIVAQALLARFMSQDPRIALVHAGALFAIGGWSVVRRDIRLGLTIIAYLPGAEIIWRQSGAPLPQYTAAYLAIGIAGAAAFTTVRSISQPGRRVLFYVALMVPSILVTISVAGGTARQAITFALVGPVTLAILVVLLSQVVIQPWFYRRLLWALAISGVGPLAIALTAISDAGGNIDFGSESNFITSGGFGPVQVSSVMGLTALVAVLLVLSEPELVPRGIAVLLAILATVQSFLTFSRGGMFATALALGALAVSQANSRDGRRRVLAVVGVFLAFGYFVIVPRLDDYTQGAFKERFEDTSSGRTTLASNDLALFRDHLAFGVGPGMSKYSRLPFELCQLRTDRCADEGSSHTEFTRMLSEHGLAGLGAIVVFSTVVLGALRASGPSRSTCVTFLTWAVAQMFYANLRVVAIPVAFGFAFLRIRAGTADDTDGEAIAADAGPASAGPRRRPDRPTLPRPAPA